VNLGGPCDEDQGKNSFFQDRHLEEKGSDGLDGGAGAVVV